MKDSAVYAAVTAWVARVTGTKTIRSHEGGKHPRPPLVVVNLTGTHEIRAHPQNVEYSGDVMAVPVLDVEWRFSLHAYGPNPTDILRPLRSVAHIAQANEPLMPGMTVFDVSQIRRVPDFVNERWEDRAQIDLFVRGLTRDGVVIDVIEQHEINFFRK